MRNPALSSERAGYRKVSLRGRYALLLGVALIVVALDQLFKALVVDRLKSGQVIDLFGGLIRLDYTENTGAAFGLLRTGGWVFVIVAIGVSVGIVMYYRQIAASPLMVRLGLGLVLGGALGNLVDRLRLGHVVDFIDLRWWPVFNLADSSIVLGVMLLALASLLTGPEGQTR